LLEHGFTLEAKALLELVWERYPSAKDKLADLGVKVAVRRGSWDEVVGGLNDAAIPEEKRAAIESLPRGQLTDLSALADCAALAPQHPLRVAAVALRKAFETVASGPVAEDVLSLPEVSHRGPLAPWKTLVRAIAHFYRQDDSACERCLQNIVPDSVPARLVPALQAMVAQRRIEHRLSAASASLVDQVGGSMEALRNALGALDAAFPADGPSRITLEAQRAISACRAACPELVERLQQHIAVRAVNSETRLGRLQAAMGGPAIQNAYFWRLFARLLESSADSLVNKALGFLEQAEKLDALNPEVRRAPLRLLVAQAIRHLRQRKPRRAEEKLVDLEALPQAHEADRPAFLAALRWTGCVIVSEAEAASGYFRQVSRLLGSPAAAVLICQSAGTACGLDLNEVNRHLPHKVFHDRTDSLAAAVARACALGDDMNVAFTMPSDFQREIFKELSDDHCSLEASQLPALAEAALRHRLGE
jgi:hypothetical protein